MNAMQALSNEEIWQLVLQNYTTVATAEQGAEENKVVELKPVDKSESVAVSSLTQYRLWSVLTLLSVPFSCYVRVSKFITHAHTHI